MNSYKEIGGYFQLERGSGLQIHPESSCLLNSARNALRSIVHSLGIKRIQVPYYTCPVVWRALEAENCEIIPYDVDDAFFPLLDSSDIPLLYTNYFGLCNNVIEKVKRKFPSLIVDNAQAFYAKPEGIACFWSPRKFFGLPDGGILWTSYPLTLNLPSSESWQRCSHLLKRWDLGASAGYVDFQKNDASLNDENPLTMSNLTQALMSSIDVEAARERRCRNFKILHQVLASENIISLDLQTELNCGAVPLVYPFRMKDLELRRHLISKKVFTATYWPPEVGCECMTSESAQMLAREIIPLPIDQRYDESDMQRILEVLYE